MKLNNRGTVFKLVFLVAMIAWPTVYRNDYATNVMVIAGIYAMLTVGFALLFGQAGQPSLGHAAFFGIGAYTAGLLTVRFGTPPVLALIAGGIAAGAVAFILGIPVLRLRGIMLVLVTMALGEIFYVVVREARAFTGGLSGRRPP
ncbi:MAG: branched-chain amino acid ABC transporter permease, partial [Chloroflexi bacterium]|nr:branched-chain amino acid ABC transporter permease [Chloroflexota bacterium]